MANAVLEGDDEPEAEHAAPNKRARITVDRTACGLTFGFSAIGCERLDDQDDYDLVDDAGVTQANRAKPDRATLSS